MAEENKNQEAAPQEIPPTEQPTPAQPEEKPIVSQEERIFSAMAYLSVAFVIPLILKPDSKTCQFHARQGAGMFALCIFVLIMLMVMPMIGTLFFLGFFGLSVLAIYKAYSGEMWKIPVIGAFAGKIDLNKLMTTIPAKKKEEPKPVVEQKIETPIETTPTTPPETPNQ